MKWKCNRCNEEVDMKSFTCKCITSPSPSPWKPITSDEELLCKTCGCEIHPCIPCEEVIRYYNNVDSTYTDLLKKILKDGRRKKNRTGTDTIGIFGEQAKFDVNLNAFPILTTKKVHFKAIVHELLWFISGSTNIKYLVDNDVHIWDAWAYKKYKNIDLNKLSENNRGGFPPHWEHKTQKEFIQKIKDDADFAEEHGELGKGTYGGMWRDFPTDDIKDGHHALGVDQLSTLINKLKTNPDDRRLIVSAWHPYWVDNCELPPCHVLFQFHTEELTLEERANLVGQTLEISTGDISSELMQKYVDSKNVPTRRLNCQLYQRSCDTFLGIPFNITSYCLLVAMIAHCVDMSPGIFTHTYGDLHIYENHIEQVNEQLSRIPILLPKLELNTKIRNLFDFKYDDITLVNYISHPTIKGAVAV